MPKRNSHCSFCGTAFDAAAGWPRTCAACAQVSYLNPVPVAVVLLPVDGGLLTVRRDIEPQRGKLALPGGFINHGESWQHAAARELEEETGIHINPDGVTDFRVLSAPDGTLLVFGLAPAVTAADLPRFEANTECSECVVLRQPEELAFSLHTEVVREFFTSPPIPSAKYP